MTEIIFIRHAATELAGTFCGHLDPPLNALGQEQISRLVQSDWLAGLAAVCSSDLQRARTTAQAIAGKLDLPLKTEAVWRELGFGAWEGLAWAQIEQLDAAYARRWADEFPRLPAPDGEDYNSFCERIVHAVKQLRESPSTVAVVTHAGVLRVILQELCGVQASQSWELTAKYCCAFRMLNHGAFEVLA